MSKELVAIHFAEFIEALPLIHKAIRLQLKMNTVITLQNIQRMGTNNFLVNQLEDNDERLVSSFFTERAKEIQLSVAAILYKNACLASPSPFDCFIRTSRRSQSICQNFKRGNEICRVVTW